MPLFLARASARGIIIILHLAIGAPAESLERGAWGVLGSVDEGVASLVRLWTLEENIFLIKQCLQCAVGTEELRK